MKKLPIFISILSIFWVANSHSSALSKPNEADVESTCRTLLYQVVSEKGNKEKIVVLNAAYKMICSEATGESYELIHEQFSSISNGLADSGACLSASGFVSSGISGGWTHHEIERFKKFNGSTGGGWDHMEIEKYLNHSPFIGDLSENELLRYKNLVKSGYELNTLESTVELMNIQRFQQLQPKIKELNNQLDSLNLDSFKGIELNKQLQLTP